MKLLVPKVRVGDVLRGTRNLRNWLRTASLLCYLQDIAEGAFAKPAKKLLYTPTKKEDFVVCVNSENFLGVWNPGSWLTLAFQQPGGSASKQHPSRMDPGLFAQWFIKTDRRCLDLRNWPDHAYVMWCGVQMRASWVRNTPVSLPLVGGCQAPFSYSHLVRCSRGDAYDAALSARKWGLVRHQKRALPGTSPYFSGTGPLLADIPNMLTKISEITGNPRILQAARADERMDGRKLNRLLEAIKNIRKSLEK